MIAAFLPNAYSMESIDRCIRRMQGHVCPFAAKSVLGPAFTPGLGYGKP